MDPINFKYMDEAFVFDNYVTGRAFVGRRSDCTALGNLVANHENVCIYGAPKSGKTSLVHQALINLKTSGVGVEVPSCDLSGVRTVGEFVTSFVSSLMRQLCDGPSDYADFMEHFLSGTGFAFDEALYEDFGNLAVFCGDVSAGDVTEALTLPYRVASERACNLCVVFDEFQNIMEINGFESILKEMERIAVDNAGSGASYIFCGSSVNAMKWMFEYKKYFFRNVAVLPMSPITEQEVIDHIVDGFRPTGKVIEKDLIQAPYRVFGGNMWYINLMASFCNARAIGYINEKTIRDSIETVISLNEPRFRMVVADLTVFQMSFLRAVLRGETRFSASDVIEKYDLHSSANVKRVRDALMKKEILTFTNKDEPVVIDPLFEFWFRRKML